MGGVRRWAGTNTDKVQRGLCLVEFRGEEEELIFMRQRVRQ